MLLREVHWVLLGAAALGLVAATLLALFSLRRRDLTPLAARAAAVGFLFLLADALGRSPIVLREHGDVGRLWAVLDVTVRAVPVVLWAIVLLGRWRGWLADRVFVGGVLLLSGLTLLVWLLPL